MKFCLNCKTRIYHKRHLYCSRQCYLKQHTAKFHLSKLQLNILQALADCHGVRWLPQSPILYTMAYCRNNPWIEVVDQKAVGLGTKIDWLVRLTLPGLDFVEKLRLYD